MFSELWGYIIDLSGISYDLWAIPFLHLTEHVDSTSIVLGYI